MLPEFQPGQWKTRSFKNTKSLNLGRDKRLIFFLTDEKGPNDTPLDEFSPTHPKLLRKCLL